MRPLAVILIVMASATSLGCASDQFAEFNASVSDLRQESSDLDAAISDGESLLATLPEGDERDSIISGLAELKESKAAADAGVDKYLARIAELGEDATPLDGLSAASEAVSTFLPPPAGQIAGLVGVIAGVIANSKRKKLKKAVEKVVLGIEEGRDDDGKIDLGDPATRANVRSVMGSDGQALVREVKAKNNKS